MISQMVEDWSWGHLRLQIWVEPETGGVLTVNVRDHMTGSVIATAYAGCANPGRVLFEGLSAQLTSRALIDIEVLLCSEDGVVRGERDRRTIRTPFEFPDLPLDCSGVTQDLGPTSRCSALLSDLRRLLSQAQEACARQASSCDEAYIDELQRAADWFAALAVFALVLGAVLSIFIGAAAGWLLLAMALYYAIHLSYLARVAEARVGCRDAIEAVRRSNQELGNALRTLRVIGILTT